jgi:predicted nucleic acid-binding protein
VRKLLDSETGDLVLPAPISAEVDYLISKHGGRDAERRFLVDLAVGRLLVEGLTMEEHGLALTLHDRYRDLDLGLADLSVVILAHRYRCRRLLTFDERHFRAVIPISGGSFTILPADG